MQYWDGVLHPVMLVLVPKKVSDLIKEWLDSALNPGGPSAQEGVSKEVFVPINEDQKVLRGLLGVG